MAAKLIYSGIGAISNQEEMQISSTTGVFEDVAEEANSTTLLNQKKLCVSKASSYMRE